MKNFRNKGGLIGLLMSGCLLVAANISIAAEDHNDRTISLSGMASASVDPDLVTVRFGVESREDSSDAALRANATAMQSVVSSLQDEGVEEGEISTSQFNIQAIYETQQDRQTGVRTQVLSGYQVNNMLSVETKNLDLVAPVIDAAVKAGVNRIDGVQFSISPAVMAEIKNQLIAEAVLNARAKAEIALAPLGYEIAGLQNMVLSDFSHPGPMLGNSPRMEMAMSAPTQIFSSDQDVRTSVNVTFLIGQAKQN